MARPLLSTILGPDAKGYWADSRKPLASLAFIAPMLVAYEAGVLLLRHQAVRNGADAWMRQWLAYLGFSQYFLLPLLTVGVLLGWHYVSRQSWHVSGRLLWGMAAESAILAICLRLLLELQGFIMQSLDAAARASIFDKVAENVAGPMSFLGAGVYEELLFRLILLPAAIGVFAWMRLERRESVFCAVVATSLLFSAAHYVGPLGDPFLWTTYRFWFTFLFRLIAGVFFSVLFLFRGFGIAAGTHAGYDLLVGLSTIP